MGAALAGLAGALMAPLITLNPEVGPTFLARSFLVVIIGGIGSVLAAIGGAVVVGLGEGIISSLIRPVYAQMMLFVRRSSCCASDRRGCSGGGAGSVNARLVALRLMVIAAVALWSSCRRCLTPAPCRSSRFILFGLAALGLDLLWGRAGLLSFGHAALFGLGCYASGLVLTNDVGGQRFSRRARRRHAPGDVRVRRRPRAVQGSHHGVYFGIVTLFAALLFEQLAGTWGGLTGGFNGLVVPVGLHVRTAAPSDTDGMYFAVLFVAVVTYVAPVGSRDAVRHGRRGQPDERRSRRVARLRRRRFRAVTLAWRVPWLASAARLYAPLEGFVYPNQLGLVASTASSCGSRSAAEVLSSVRSSVRWW